MTYARMDKLQKWMLQVLLQLEHYDHFGVKRYAGKFFSPYPKVL
jgi:hypothetical protein